MTRRIWILALLAIVSLGCGASTAATPSVRSAEPVPTATDAATAVATPTPQPTSMPSPTPSPSPTPAAVRLPPPNAAFDYQLGGAYPPPKGVTVVSRDRTASPAPGRFNICYVNGFQIQDDEVAWWKANHPDLMLRDQAGKPVIDPDWNEILLAPTTAARRAGLADVIGGWIDGCAADGFDAVEIDNLDTFTRSNGLITEDEAVAQIRLYADAAHAHGLAIAQKNSAEITGRRAEMGTDFAVAEECDRYSECDAYTTAYGDHVLVIEYRRRDFDKGCAAYPQLSIVLARPRPGATDRHGVRLRRLLTAARPGFEGCHVARAEGDLWLWPRPVSDGTLAARRHAMKILVAYATRHGATKGIAERIAQTLEHDRAGRHAAAGRGGPGRRRLRRIRHRQRGLHGRLAGPATAFVRRNRDVLAGHRVWLFSSGPIGSEPVDAKGRDQLVAATPEGVHRSSPARSGRMATACSSARTTPRPRHRPRREPHERGSCGSCRPRATRSRSATSATGRRSRPGPEGIARELQPVAVPA